MFFLIGKFGNNNRKVIIFTDESMQSRYSNPEQTLITSCIEHSYSVSAFIPSNLPGYNQWQNITQSCSGFLEYLYYNSTEMTEKLNYYFGSETC